MEQNKMVDVNTYRKRYAENGLPYDQVQSYPILYPIRLKNVCTLLKKKFEKRLWYITKM